MDGTVGTASNTAGLRRRRAHRVVVASVAVVLLGATQGACQAPGGLFGPQGTPTKAPPQIRVYVAGAVATPGVYRLSPEDRVEELVKAAGGLSHDADVLRVNLAQRISDEQRVIIPRLPTPTPEPTATTPRPTATPQPTATPPPTRTPPATPTV